MSGEDEAFARKAASERLLSAEGVPFIAHLPAIETAAECTLRTPDAIVDRVFCLFVVSAKAIGGRFGDDVAPHVESWRLAYTPNEKRFLAGEVSEHERIMMSWCCEGAPPLLWAIQRMDVLPRPDSMADFTLLDRVVEEGPAALSARARLRDIQEILDAADLIYRYHWAVRSAALGDIGDPGVLHPGVVFERHRALNWLIGYCGEEWDDVTTDT